MLLEEYDEEKTIRSWNLTLSKLQEENEKYRSENANIRSENASIRSENQRNMLQTVLLLRELGKNDKEITQILVNKYNISKENVSFYLK